MWSNSGVKMNRSSLITTICPWSGNPGSVKVNWLMWELAVIRQGRSKGSTLALKMVVFEVQGGGFLYWHIQYPLQLQHQTVGGCFLLFRSSFVCVDPRWEGRRKMEEFFCVSVYACLSINSDIHSPFSSVANKTGLNIFGLSSDTAF